MSPLEIKVLLHCYVCPAPYDGPENVNAIAAIIHNLIMNNLVDPEPTADKGYRTTERGRAHCIQLMETPWPIAAWVNNRGGIIK